MANAVRQFVDPAGNYTGGYTSDILPATDLGYQAFQTRGVVQVEITSGSVELEMRLTPDAPWISIATYTSNTIEEIVMANFMRIVATGAARAWLGVVR
jgi:hypothetical protein